MKEMEYPGGKVFSYARICNPSDIPAADQRIVDIAVLDMNCGWPNLGHDLVVRAVADVAHDLSPLLESAGVSIRVLSYDVRGSLMIPVIPCARHRIYIGTGGPGHIDPHLNDGVSVGSQGIREDPSWKLLFFAYSIPSILRKTLFFLGSAIRLGCYAAGQVWHALCCGVLKKVARVLAWSKMFSPPRPAATRGFQSSPRNSPMACI